MDDLIDEIINYVSETPENTNNRILRPMLERLGNSSSGSTGGGGVMIARLISDNSTDRATLDKTFQEMYNAVISGSPVYIYNDVSNSEPTTTISEDFDLGPATLRSWYG